MGAEKTKLESEVETLRAQVGVLEEALKKALLDKRFAEDRLARWMRRYFGPKSEKINPAPLALAFEELAQIAEEQQEPPTPEHAREAADDDEGTKSKAPRKSPHGRKPLPASLPRERIEHLPSANELHCTPCTCAKTAFGEEVTEELEYVPSSFKVIEHARIKFACKRCQEGVSIAALPDRVIEKGRPGPGLLAFVMTAKYCDRLPLYRLESIFERHGLDIARSTMCAWIARCAELLAPIFDELKRSVLESAVIDGDDTPVLCLEDSVGGGRRQGYLWVYVGDRKELAYDFTLSRGRDGPNVFLKGWKGKLQVDAHTSWEKLFESGDVLEVGCWAHARRYFFEASASDAARASRVVALIQQLYAIEKTAKAAGLSAEQLTVVRQAESRPILGQIRQLIDELAKDALPKTDLGRAISYANNQWDALVRFVDDGRLDIDNNSAERGMRNVAVGRKNWLFTGSFEGGKRAALLYALIGTCKLQGVEPFAYLRDVLQRLSTHSASRVAELTPRGWKLTHAEAVG